MKFTIADGLTSLRLILVPVFLYYFLTAQQVVALTIFAIAGFTDLIDGTVARLTKQTSKLGAILDPVADKLLMGSCFLMLTLQGVLPWWFFWLALGRDIMILSGVYYLEKTKAKFAPRALVVSKIATLILLTTAILGLIAWWRPELVYIKGDFANWFDAFIVIAAVLITMSGVQYVRLGFKILRENKKLHGNVL